MNETEIRTRLREAVGEADYPPELGTRVAARLNQPPAPSHPRAIGFVAAMLAVLIVVSLVYIRVHSGPALSPAAGPSPTPVVVPGPNSVVRLPDADLAAAGLTAAGSAVTPLNLVVTAGGRTVTLVGGYADPTRIVLVFRTLPDAGAPQVHVSDDGGAINAAYFGARGVVGDQVVGLQRGPHVSAGAIAHLTATVTGFAQLGSPKIDSGSWTFSAALPVQQPAALSLTPRLTSVGTWKVNVEAFELTPSVIHLRALVSGTEPSGITDSTAVLVGPDGSPVKPLTLDPVAAGSNQTRLDATWIRPAAAASDQLQVNGGGGQYSTHVLIPAPPPLDSGKPGKGQPLTPLSFPPASEALDVQGAINDHITSGRPQSCGSGSGPDGKRIYVFATYFQSSDVWYYISFSTDPAKLLYQGPGTYTVKAWLSPVAMLGPTDPMFIGSAQLTVSSDTRLQSGRVVASLGWTDDPQQKVLISGSWTCMFSSELGPA